VKRYIQQQDPYSTEIDDGSTAPRFTNNLALRLALQHSGGNHGFVLVIADLID
jgi:hypothetical protein